MALRVAGPMMLAAVLAAGSAQAEGDAVKGKQIFAKCAICHDTVPGKNKIGPSLAGIVGRPSGSIPGFKYSPANLAANVTWDEATLDKYLIDPKAMIKGTTMPFPGDKNDAERRPRRLPQDPEIDGSVAAGLRQCGEGCAGSNLWSA